MMLAATKTTVDNDLLEQYKKIHATKEYGTSGDRVFKQCLPFISSSWTSALDYGCGRSKTLELLPDHVTKRVRYDPAIPDFAKKPKGKFDFLICTDVLEHVREETVPAILAHIFSLSSNVFFSIALRPAIEILPNGQNAHVTVKPLDWWIEKIENTNNNSNNRTVSFRQIAYHQRHSWVGLVSLVASTQ